MQQFDWCRWKRASSTSATQARALSPNLARFTIDQSEALRAYAESAKLSAEIISDITELSLIAKRRLGEITADMKNAPKGSNQYKKMELPDGGSTKTATLSAAGIDIRRANEAEKLKDIDEDVFNDLP
jgi:hypothetical protein